MAIRLRAEFPEWVGIAALPFIRDGKIYIKIERSNFPFTDADGYPIYHVSPDEILVSSDGKSWITILNASPQS